MQEWAEAPWMVLDLETTGPDPKTARPVELAWLVVDREGKMLQQYHTLIDADVDIPEDASKVHGITNAMVKERSLKSLDAMGNIQSLLKSHQHLPLVIFNVPYDWPLLKYEGERQGKLVDFTPKFLDPLLLDRIGDKWRKGKRTLGAMVEVYGVTLHNAHSALGDAVATGMVMRKMLKRGFGEHSLEGLQEAQARWHRVWKIDINAYWKRKGEQKEVTNGWPE